jgi:hypothetical protein
MPPIGEVSELVVDQAVSSGVVSGIVRLLTSTAFQSIEIIRLAAQLLTAIATVPALRTKGLEYAREAVERGAVSALMKVIGNLDSLQNNVRVNRPTNSMPAVVICMPHLNNAPQTHFHLTRKILND